MTFKNRDEAARLLAERLRSYRGERPLVLAIPRGAVPMGKILADELGADLDVVLVRKIGAPGNPEYAIGAVSEYGDVRLSGAADFFNISEDYINEKVREEMETMKQRRQSYSPILHPVDPRGRTVILVDDGIATGATMISAAEAVRSKDPSKIIIATPVASTEAVERMKQFADEVVVVHVSDQFYAVSQFYEEFGQVSDDEVRESLRSAAGGRQGRAA